MQSEELISAKDFCTFHHVETTFLYDLQDAGLISLTLQEGVYYFAASDLPGIEKFVRWHYELEINPAGIEALHHVLQNLQAVMHENQSLRQRLERFQHDTPEDPIQHADLL